MSARRPVLIVGLPRSGTTWTLRALACAEGTHAILEPDNEDKFPAAIHGKRKVGRYPVLAPGDSAPAYHRLWEWVLGGAPEGRRSPVRAPAARARQQWNASTRDVPDPVTWLASTVARDPRAPDKGASPWARFVAKSIHAQLAVEWLADEFDLDVLLLLRHPANVLASWMENNLKDSRNSTLETRDDIRERYLEPWGVPLPGPDPIERMSWRIGLLAAAIEDAHRRHPEWQIRTHEALCSDMLTEFRSLYDDLGLEWTPATEQFLAGPQHTGERLRRQPGGLGALGLLAAPPRRRGR